MLQYLKRITHTVAYPLSRETFYSLINDNVVELQVRLGRQALQEGNKASYQKAKQLLPSVMWMGYDPRDGEVKSRKAKDLVPTQLYMIDIDHCKEDPRNVWEKIAATMKGNDYDYKIRVVHVTPSGEGLRIVAEATRDFPTVREHMDWLVEELGLMQYGDYDSQCKDLSRQSFLVPKGDFIRLDERIFNEPTFKPIKGANNYGNAEFDKGSGEPERGSERELQPTDGVQTGNGEPGIENDGTGEGDGKSRLGAEDAEQTDRQSQRGTATAETDYTLSEYRGHKLTDIVAKYVEVFGEPEEGERHAFYNKMAKEFRLICNNNARQLYAILPAFGNPDEERKAQCKYFCKESHQSRMSKEFFMFLLNNGFYPRRTAEKDAELKAYLEDETPKVEKKVPKLPPVFREYCSICPPDFILPTVNALMPILGTLTSYVRAEYFDGSMQSPSFFNVIYAGAGSGKSYINRFKDPLFKYIYARDEIASMREQIFLTQKSGKGGNEKDPVDPHVSVRIMPAINSQPEFLTKMRDNKGYHMFTFAEEVDTFNKGTRAGGGDKSDLFRIAWDNGKYGQSFKSAATFKGMVNLYYNILLTGTPAQVKNYYRNCENGMVTRVSFCEIENQEFASAPRWKKLNAVQKKVIERAIARFDENTYKEPLDFTIEQALEVDEKEFDTTVPWRYNYKPFKVIDMEWLFPTLNKWLEKERRQASLEQDYARDTFRRRVAVKGFRLAMVCTEMWTKVTKAEQKIICDFVEWWMDYDMEQSLKLFQKKYNDLMNENIADKIATHNNSVFAELPETFDKADVVAKLMRFGLKTPARLVVHRWMRDDLIEKVDKNIWKKKV